VWLCVKWEGWGWVCESGVRSKGKRQWEEDDDAETPPKASSLPWLRSESRTTTSMTNRTTPGLSYTTRRLCKCSIQMCLSPFLHTPSIQVKPRPPVIRSKQQHRHQGFLYCMCMVPFGSTAAIPNKPADPPSSLLPRTVPRTSLLAV